MAIITNREDLEKIARGNIERHLADAITDYDNLEEGVSTDAIYSEAYTLAVDTLLDAGVERALAQEIAAYLARIYAQP